MKVIFLDFDGVLNSSNWAHSFPDRCPSGDDMIDPIAVGRLNKIVEATGAHVVVSSVWRKCRRYPRTELQEILNRFGFKGTVLGITPSSKSGIRGGEIQEWIDTYNRHELTSFVIIDDSSDMAHLMHKLVRTEYLAGLQDHHVTAAIEMLNKE
jgi:hypothetical protein